VKANDNDMMIMEVEHMYGRRHVPPFQAHNQNTVSGGHKL